MFLRCSFFNFVVLVISVASLGCSADNTVTPKPDPKVVEPEPKPKPDWADDIITIQAGRFKNGHELLKRILNTKQYFIVSWIREDLRNPNFPMAPEPYTIDVAIVAMTKAGFTAPATLEVIVDRYQELGCRPLTDEEVIELRLQFTDQPEVATGALTSEFYVLPSKRALMTSSSPLPMYLICNRHDYNRYPSITHAMIYDHDTAEFSPFGEKLTLELVLTVLFRPHDSPVSSLKGNTYNARLKLCVFLSGKTIPIHRDLSGGLGDLGG